MSAIPANVQPGDLITASFMNSVLAELTSLDGRVSKLEAGGTIATGAISITSVLPQPVQAGQDVTIVGTNLGFLEGAYSYTFNGVATPAIRPGSNDTTLTCQVPFLSGLAPNGSQVTLSMYNGTSSTTASTTIVVVPAPVVVQGSIDTVFDSVTPDPLTAGATTNFTFHLQSRASAAVTLDLAPAVVAAGGTSFPTPSLLNAAGQPLAGNSITLNPADLQSFIVQLDIPAGTNNTSFTLTVTGTGGGITSSSGALAFTVGQLADPDPTFTLAPSAASPTTALSGTTITASVSTAEVVDVAVDAEFTVLGTYTLTLTTPGTSNWASAISEPSPPQIEVTQAEIGSLGTATATIHVRVQPSAGATNPGALQLTVQRQGATQSRTLTFNLIPD
jgi:IPT/TIG domain